MQAQVDRLTEQLYAVSKPAEPAAVNRYTYSMSPELSEASIECSFDGQNYVLFINAIPVLFDAAEQAQFVLRYQNGAMYFDADSYLEGMYTAVVRTAVGNPTDFSVYLTLTKDDQTRSLLVGALQGDGGTVCAGCCGISGIFMVRRYAARFYYQCGGQYAADAVGRAAYQPG